MAAADSFDNNNSRNDDAGRNNHFTASDPNESRGSVNVVGGSRSGHDEALRLRLKSFIARRPHLTTAVLSRDDHTGVSKTALDLILEGEYFLRGGPKGTSVNPKKSGLEQKIRSYLDRVEVSASDDRAEYTDAFTRTVLSSQLDYACNTAVTENIIVVAYGSPGHGKSFSMRQYMLDRLQTRPVTVLCSKNITLGYFVRSIARELKISTSGCIPDIEDRIADKLIKNKRPIFVDQANYLNENALGSVCHIWERAKVGIVLIGTYNLFELFNGLRDTEDIKGQLSSRVALMVPLMGLSAAEAKTIILNSLGPEIATPDVIAKIFNAVSRTIVNEAGEQNRIGNFRNLNFFLPRLKTLIDKHSVEISSGAIKTEELVEKAAGRLMLD